MSKFSKRLVGLVLTLAALGLVLAVPAGSAFAHETRDVAGGKYQFRVGFIAEPAYQGLENGLELTICTGQCSTKPDSNGVLANGLAGAFDTLKAEVIVGPSTMPLTLVAIPYNPGKYNSKFVPTRVGDYSFHIFGTLGADKIDERFTSSPNTFDGVQPLTIVQFPDKPGFNQAGSVSVAAATPVSNPASTPVAGPTASASTPVNATPVAAVAPAATVPAGASASDIQDLKQQLATQQQALETAKNNASSANSLGIAGLFVGIVGIILAGVALFLRRSPAQVKPRREQEGG